jgi:uncharacterized protein YbjT (DUF2867 family)
MITVMGATGQTGGATARRLLEGGEHVRALGRSADRLAALRDAGAEPFPVDASDATALTEAFRGANAAYVLLPISPEVPDWHAHMAQLGEAIVTAVRAAGVPYVVAVSSVGADLPSGTGFLTGLHAQEQRLETLTDVAHVLALRPGAYFENAYGWLPVIAEQGVMADSVAPNAPLPMVATRDVGAAAAAALRSRDWTGFAVRELLRAMVAFLTNDLAAVRARHRLSSPRRALSTGHGPSATEEMNRSLLRWRSVHGRAALGMSGWGTPTSPLQLSGGYQCRPPGDSGRGRAALLTAIIRMPRRCAFCAPRRTGSWCSRQVRREAKPLRGLVRPAKSPSIWATA